MNLKQFGRQLWLRYLLFGLRRPFFLSLSAIWILALIDWYFRLSVLWRLTALVGILSYIVHKTYSLIVNNKPPSQDELYHLACSYHDHQELSLQPDALTLPKSKLIAWPVMSMVMFLFLTVSPLTFDLGRFAAQRTFFLSGQWPKKTRIANLQIPKYVEQGTPITFSFTTEGEIPRIVRLKINEYESSLIGTTSKNWNYDFFHDPGSIKVSVFAGDDSIENYQVTVLPSPTLVEAEIIWKEPGDIGGENRIQKGIVAKIVEGSNVTLKARFKETSFIVLNGKSYKLTPDGMLEITIGELLDDQKLEFKARAHPSLSLKTVTVFRLSIIEDKLPQITQVTPKKKKYALAGSWLDISYACEDDYGLKKSEVIVQNETPLTEKHSGLKASVEHRVNFPLDQFKAGDDCEIVIRVCDQKDQWGPSEKIHVQIIDPETFQQRLTEQQQVVQKDLERMLSSMTRRLKRYKTNRLLALQAENSNLRLDLERNSRLVESLGQYLINLNQLGGFELNAQQIQKDKNYLNQNVKNLLRLILNDSQPRIDRQQTIVENLEEMSRRMAQNQDFHLVLKLLDQMIAKQDKMTKGILTQ